MSKGRGRKRKATAVRHPSGQVVRKERVDEARDTVVTARERVFGLSRERAKQPEAGDAIGRLYQSGNISKVQKEAADEYGRVVAEYRVSSGAKGNPRSAGDFSGTAGYDGSDGDDPAYIERCQRAHERMARSRRELLKADPFAQFAVDAWVIEGREVWSVEGSLRVGLNALARLYRVNEWTRDRAA